MLEKLSECLENYDIDRDFCEGIQLAVAEALNNVCKYAYRNRDVETVDIRVKLEAERIKILISDNGVPISADGSLPEPEVDPNPEEIDAVPEGGYGWYIIRSLASEIDYQRSAGKNGLSLAFDIPEKTAGPDPPHD